MAGFGRHRSGEPRFAGRAAIVGLAIGLLGLLMIQSSHDVRKSMQDSRARMDDVSTSISSSAKVGVRGFFALFSNKAKDAEIKALQDRVFELEHWRNTANSMAARMQQYENILDLMGEPPLGGRTARIVAEVNGPFSQTRIANVGGAGGVSVGYAAINQHGLIGRVVRTGERTSRILLLTDYNSRIPVMGRVSLDRALLVGDRSVGARLMYAETPDRIVEGEEWVTSGDDGIFERGMTVGYARRYKEGWRLDLAMNRSALDFVRLLPPPDFLAPEDLPVDEAVRLKPNDEKTLRSMQVSAVDGVAGRGGRP